MHLRKVGDAWKYLPRGVILVVWGFVVRASGGMRLENGHAKSLSGLLAYCITPLVVVESHFWRDKQYK